MGRMALAMLKDLGAIAFTVACMALAAAVTMPAAVTALQSQQTAAHGADAFVANLWSWRGPLNVVGWVIVFLVFRMFGDERAQSFGISTRGRNLAAALRDYLAVCALTLLACAGLARAATGSAATPTGLLVGAALSWCIPAALVNLAGLTESRRETWLDLAIVAALMAAAPLVRFLGHAGPWSWDAYLSGMATVYVVAMPAAVVRFPDRGLMIKLQGNRLKVFAQAVGVASLLFLLPGLLTIAVVLLAFVLGLFLTPVWAVVMWLTHQHMNEKSFEAFLQAVAYAPGLPPVAFAYVTLADIAARFVRLTREALQGAWPAAVELAAYATAMVMALRRYRRVFPSNRAGK